MPYVVERVGWNAAFTLLAIGPFMGTIALLRFRRMPESEKSRRWEDVSVPNPKFASFCGSLCRELRI